MEAIVLDKDTTGRLWVTYTQNNQVYVNRSLGDDQSWGTPFVLPVNGTTVSADDISGVVAFDSQIGVMWSNQVDDAMYFATHTDGDPDNVWQGSRTAIQGPKTVDDHISLRSLQADDVSGRVFAAVKTSLGDLPNADTNAPLILLLVRDQAGNWTNKRFGRVIDHHTRPIVIIDQEHRNLYMFATAPENSGTIYYKKSSLSNISFSEGLGTPFIQSATDTHINNATSTKQNVNSATGLPVLASDDTSRFYWHNIMDLGNADTVPPTVSGVVPTEGASGVNATANTEAAFSEGMDPATITSSTFTLTKQGASQPLTAQVSYDTATKKATLDPTADLEASATYTATIKGGTSGVKDLAGNPLGADKTWSFSTPTPPQGSQTINLNSVADAGLTELAPTTNNGTATTLKVDGVDPDPGGGDLYAALRWDLSQIPAGATVSNASVTLNITNASPQTYGAYDLKRAWNESQISWNQAATGTPWATAGAKGATDRGSQIASVTPTKKAPYTFTIPASVVQGWVNDPSSNNGILLAHTINDDGFAFDTKEGRDSPEAHHQLHRWDGHHPA